MKKRIIKIFIIECLVIFVFVFLINFVVIRKTSKYINSNINYNDYNYVIVLGAKVEGNTLSLMLKDRLDKALEIYKTNNNIKIIVSGDSQNPNIYDEVSVMRNYLIQNGVEEDSIISDNYGISTYDSIVRMKNIIKDEKIIIVTQKYHLYRSIYIAKELDIDAYGVSAREYKYYGQLQRNIREILARVKDYVLVKINAKSKY